MKKIYKHLIVICIVLLSTLPGKGTISLITLTPASPTTMSTSNDYYLAGNTYNFSVNVVDNDITGWANITSVSLSIENDTNITASFAPSTGTGTYSATTAGTGETIQAVVTGAYNNFTVVFQVPITWDVTDESTYTTGRTISASATTNVPGSNTSTDSATLDYGVCASMRVLSFQQDGVAADG